MLAGMLAAMAVKLVLVTDANPAAAAGGTGLFRRWIQEYHLTQTFGVPGMDSPMRSDGQGTLAMVTGTGAGAAVQVTAMASDPRLDLTRAYWLVAGTAAGNPERVSLGSVVWADAVVSGDEAFEFDRADAPADWPYGIVPLKGAAPKRYPPIGDSTGETVYFPLNPDLAQMGFLFSRDAAAPDSKEMRAARAAYTGYENSVRPPFVVQAGIVAASRYWHGKVLNQWAVDWARYASGGRSAFAAADTSDQAICAALTGVARGGRVDFARIAVLRAIGNYTIDPTGRARDRSLDTDYAGFGWAADAAFRAAGPLVRELLQHWDRYEARAP